MGGEEDPTLKHSAHWFERYTAHLQEVSYQKTRRIIDQYRPVIEKIADHIYTDEKELILGPDLIDIIKNTPLKDSNIPEPTFKVEDIYSSFSYLPNEIEDKGSIGSCSFGRGRDGTVLFERPISAEDKAFAISKETVKQAAEVIIGHADIFHLLTPDVLESKSKQIREALRSRSSRRRLEAIRRYSLGEDVELPPTPVLETDRPLPKVYYDTLRQGAEEPFELLQDFNFWRNRNEVAKE